MNVAEMMQTSLQRSGIASSASLLSSNLPPRGTGLLSNAALADGKSILLNMVCAALLTLTDQAVGPALFPNATSLARSQLLQTSSVDPRNRMQPSPSSLLASTQSFLPTYDPRNLATGGAVPSLFRGLHGLQYPMQPAHRLGQISAEHGLLSAAAHRSYAGEALLRASASSHLPGHLTGTETFAARPPPHHPSSGLALPPPQNAREPKTLYLQCDDDSLTPYQCLARQQIQLFEASTIDAEAGTQGRNRTIRVGQVGIRCRHCGHFPLRERSRGSTYYPSKLTGLYQAAQNMTNGHLAMYCQEVSSQFPFTGTKKQSILIIIFIRCIMKIPKEIREELRRLGNKKSSAGGGKGYWSGGAKILGVIEDQHGLRFRNEDLL